MRQGVLGMASTEKTRVVICSRRIAIGIASYDMPVAGPLGRTYWTKAKTTVYKRALDSEQKAMLNEARSLSLTQGVELDVIDLGRKNPTSRFLWCLTRRIEKAPSLVFRGNSALQFLLSERRRNDVVLQGRRLGGV
jgi:hypothetical protein